MADNHRPNPVPKNRKSLKGLSEKGLLRREKAGKANLVPRQILVP
jgi:hypothetical protein